MVVPSYRVVCYAARYMRAARLAKISDDVVKIERSDLPLSGLATIWALKHSDHTANNIEPDVKQILLDIDDFCATTPTPRHEATLKMPQLTKHQTSILTKISMEPSLFPFFPLLRAKMPGTAATQYRRG